MATTIEDLSPEVLVEIFSHYIQSEGHEAFSRNVAPVCTTWWKLRSMPSLWQHFNVRNWNQALALSEKGLLQHTRRLDMDHWPSDPLLPLAVLSNIRELKSLEISFGNILSNTMTTVAKLCPKLEHLRMKRVYFDNYQQIPPKELIPVITKCGPRLKRLSFIYCHIINGEDLVIEIAAKCPSLEIFEWVNEHSIIPIHRLANGCPQLRRVSLHYCSFVTGDENDSSGFKDLTAFTANPCDFDRLDVCSLLRNANNLERLELVGNRNLILSDFSKIPSNKVQFLQMEPDGVSEDIHKNFVGLKQAVEKWKHTLIHLEISGWERNVTSVLKLLLEDNPCPKLELLAMYENSVDKDFFNMFIQKCEHLKVLKFGSYDICFKNREEIMQFRNKML